MPTGVSAVLERLADLDVQVRVTRDDRGRVVIQVELDPNNDEDSWEQVPEASDDTPCRPRDLPEAFGQLPEAIRSLSGRLYARAAEHAGRLGPEARILRAARAGARDRRLLQHPGGEVEPVEALALQVCLFAILVARGEGGPFVVFSRAAFREAVGEPAAPGAGGRGFPSAAEARAYFWGSGLPLGELPEEWPGPRRA